MYTSRAHSYKSCTQCIHAAQSFSSITAAPRNHAQGNKVVRTAQVPVTVNYMIYREVPGILYDTDIIHTWRRILFAGFVARTEGRRLPKCVMFGGRGLRGGARKRVYGVFPGRPHSFRHQRRPVNDCSPGRGEMAQGVEQGAEHFMAKWIAEQKARAGLRHAVVCPNVTGRTKERIAQSKRARAGSLAIVD